MILHPIIMVVGVIMIVAGIGAGGMKINPRIKKKMTKHLTNNYIIMRSGIKILIVVIVAVATNFGLHAAFWGRQHNGYCGPEKGGWYNQGGCYQSAGSCANPWGCNGSNSTTPTDTTKRE
jgi:hypothetical protein